MHTGLFSYSEADLQLKFSRTVEANRLLQGENRPPKAARNQVTSPFNVDAGLFGAVWGVIEVVEEIKLRNPLRREEDTLQAYKDIMGGFVALKESRGDRSSRGRHFATKAFDMLPTIFLSSSFTAQDFLKNFSPGLIASRNFLVRLAEKCGIAAMHLILENYNYFFDLITEISALDQMANKTAIKISAARQLIKSAQLKTNLISTTLKRKAKKCNDIRTYLKGLKLIKKLESYKRDASSCVLKHDFATVFFILSKIRQYAAILPLAPPSSYVNEWISRILDDLEHNTQREIISMTMDYHFPSTHLNSRKDASEELLWAPMGVISLWKEFFIHFKLNSFSLMHFGRVMYKNFSCMINLLQAEAKSSLTDPSFSSLLLILSSFWEKGFTALSFSLKLIHELRLMSSPCLERVDSGSKNLLEGHPVLEEQFTFFAVAFENLSQTILPIVSNYDDFGLLKQFMKTTEDQLNSELEAHNIDKACESTLKAIKSERPVSKILGRFEEVRNGILSAHFSAYYQTMAPMLTNALQSEKWKHTGVTEELEEILGPLRLVSSGVKVETRSPFLIINKEQFFISTSFSLLLRFLAESIKNDYLVDLSRRIIRLLNTYHTGVRSIILEGGCVELGILEEIDSRLVIVLVKELDLLLFLISFLTLQGQIEAGAATTALCNEIYAHQQALLDNLQAIFTEAVTEITNDLRSRSWPLSGEIGLPLPETTKILEAFKEMLDQIIPFLFASEVERYFNKFSKVVKSIYVKTLEACIKSPIGERLLQDEKAYILDCLLGVKAEYVKKF